MFVSGKPVNRGTVRQGPVALGRIVTPVLIKAADVVTVHVPSSPETRHLIGEKTLALMGQVGNDTVHVPVLVSGVGGAGKSGEGPGAVLYAGRV